MASIAHANEPRLDPFEASHFLIIGVITRIDPHGDTFHVGATEIVAEKGHLAGVQVGTRVEVFGLERDGRRVASRVKNSQ